MLNRKVTYRLYPNAEQESLLQETLGLHQRLRSIFTLLRQKHTQIRIPNFSIFATFIHHRHRDIHDSADSPANAPGPTGSPRSPNAAARSRKP